MDFRPAALALTNLPIKINILLVHFLIISYYFIDKSLKTNDHQLWRQMKPYKHNKFLLKNILFAFPELPPIKEVLIITLALMCLILVVCKSAVSSLPFIQYSLFSLKKLAQKLKPERKISNKGEPQSFHCRVFNFKLGCFAE
jgi:hypothetical protein